jgi:predicted RNase H-like nuclease (RuvC/YqgF family)
MKRMKLAEALDEIDRLELQIERLSIENSVLKAKLEAMERSERNPRGGGRKVIITDDMIDDLLNLIDTGATQREVASLYGVGAATVNRALRSRKLLYHNKHRY